MRAAPLARVPSDFRAARGVFLKDSIRRVSAAFALAADALPLGAAYHGSWSELFFQSPLADAAFTFTLALFSAAWSCRGAVLRGQHCRGAPPADHRAHLAACVARALDHPGLLSGSSETREERRLACAARSGRAARRRSRPRARGPARGARRPRPPVTAADERRSGKHARRALPSALRRSEWSMALSPPCRSQSTPALTTTRSLPRCDHSSRRPSSSAAPQGVEMLEMFEMLEGST